MFVPYVAPQPLFSIKPPEVPFEERSFLGKCGFVIFRLILGVFYLTLSAILFFIGVFLLLLLF